MTKTVSIANWIPPAGDISLGENEMHVWMSTIELADEVIARLSSWLSDDERERAARFRHQRHRGKFIASRAMMRGVLARYVDQGPGDIEFEYLSLGKPKLAAALRDAGLEFNLSHSGSIALCAVTRGSWVGVDVEHIRELRDMQGLANRFFSPDEARQLEHEPEDERLASFFRCWTRKEAYVKAIGQGISCPLDSFAVSITANDPPRLVHIDQDTTIAATWSMVTMVPAEQYVGALASVGRIESLRTWVWTAPESLYHPVEILVELVRAKFSVNVSRENNVVMPKIGPDPDFLNTLLAPRGARSRTCLQQLFHGVGGRVIKKFSPDVSAPTCSVPDSF
jgi:4'-phosphopantetheinyl transferase